MYRRARFIQATCLFLLALFFVASVCSHQEKKQELRISGFSRGIGAVNPGQTDLDVQKKATIMRIISFPCPTNERSFYPRRIAKVAEPFGQSAQSIRNASSPTMV